MSSGVAAALAAALTKVVGENEKEQEVKAWLETGYAPLNRIISGSFTDGVPQGRIGEIFGPSSSGKTAIATKLMIEAQKRGGVAMFFDHECSFDLGMAKEMGLDDTPGLWVYQLPETWEESNTMMLKAAQAIREAKIIPPDAPIVAITDSIAACVPKSMLYADGKGGKRKEISELTMNDNTALARVTSTTLKVVKPVTREYGLTAIYLNQIRVKPGVVYGDPTTTPGGGAMEFYSDWRLALGRRVIKEESGGVKEFVGQEITIQAKKSKFTKPFQECALRLMFTPEGRAYFDITGSTIDYCVENKLLAATNGRITWSDGKQYFRKALIEKVNSEGLQAELAALVTGSR